MKWCAHHFTHLRRPFFKAMAVPGAADERARVYLDGINRLFRIDRLAKHFRLTLENKRTLRKKYSLSLFESLLSRARDQSAHVLPKCHLGDGIRYLINQADSLRRTLQEPSAELSTNLVEAAIRPLKLGLKNWIAVGHPDAGPRLANLFTLVENCRLLGIDAERYLIDIIARLPDHPAAKVAELLPRNWKPLPAEAPATTAAGESE